MFSKVSKKKFLKVNFIRLISSFPTVMGLLQLKVILQNVSGSTPVPACTMHRGAPEVFLHQ